MPFGLCNAPATFQRLMEKVLGPLIGLGVLVYIDDVLIYAETPKQLIEILTAVLKLLVKAGLKCKASKCLLFTQTINYLGRVVSKDAINPAPAKLDKIRLWPKPEKGTGLASLLGLCNYYRDLIPAFAHISDALYKVSRAEEVPWTEDLESKFNELKQQLLQPRIVRLPDPGQTVIHETDGSRVAVGAVLKQLFDDAALEHPVGFFLRALTGSERNYAAYEVELYAVVGAFEHFRTCLLGKIFSCVPTMQPFVISFEDICPRLPGSNAGSFASLNTTSRSNTREAKTTSSQMSTLACLSPARTTLRNLLTSKKPLEK